MSGFVLYLGIVEALDETVWSQVLFCVIVLFVLLEDKQNSKFGVLVKDEKQLFSYVNLDQITPFTTRNELRIKQNSINESGESQKLFLAILCLFFIVL